MDAVGWAGIVFGLALIVGIIAPIAGVGGGVLFVPIARAFLPFHIDFVSGAGLILALTSALSASPRMIREGLANLRVVIPVTMVTVLATAVGGVAHLWVTRTLAQGQEAMTLALGGVLVAVFVVMVRAGRAGTSATGEEASRAQRGVRRALPYFAGVAFLGGMFGLGAGWANVPVLHLVLGASIKVATGTSMAIIAVNDAAASWVYLAHGAVLPVIVVPGAIGMAIGAWIGTRLALRAKPIFVRRLVLAILLLAASINVVRGLEGLGVLPWGAP
jgi:uncharacterized membrane protein YfcA